MPKYKGQIFKSKRRVSQSDGTVKVHKMDEVGLDFELWAAVLP